MLQLTIVSLLWACSFGLIKGRLAGLDSAFISAARLGLALLVFLPFLRLRGLTSRTMLTLVAIGAGQFGVMYLAYNESFRHLPAHEVALFTLTTPLFVTLLADALDRRFRLRALLANLAFAISQVSYQQLRARQPNLRDREIFALLYLGGAALAAPVALAQMNFATFALTASQASTLLYLGILASGLGFFLWNLGATRVNAGTLAVMNNAKVPLAVACSLLFFGESADLPRLLTSLAVLSVAVWLAEKKPAP